MAIISQSVMGTYRGKVGTITTYSSRAGNIARVRSNATNVGATASRTNAQQTNRTRWANLITFYRESLGWMKKGFMGKATKLTDYNQFVKINFPLCSIRFTKEEAALGACVVEGYKVTSGDLRSIVITKHTDHWDTDINLGSLQITNETTVAEFSAAVLAANNFVRNGMQLSFVSYQQYLDDADIPHVISAAYEVVIDKHNTGELLRSYLPEFCSMSGDRGVLCTGPNISIGGFVYVLSETRRGVVHVSSQKIITNNDVLIQKYSSTNQLEKAVASYGSSLDTFLSSDYAGEVSPSEQPQSIMGLYKSATEFVPVGGYIGAADIAFPEGQRRRLQFAKPIDVASSDVIVSIGIGKETFQMSVISADGTWIQVARPDTITSSWQGPVNRITVQLGDEIYNAAFVITPGGPEEHE